MKHQQVTNPAQKEQQPPPASSVRQTSLNHVAVRPLLELQQIIGNQAVQQALRAQQTQSDVSPQAFLEPRFGHDFSRIPVYSSRSPVLQTKLTINQPGDSYEQEADQVAEQVMRMSEPQRERACTCDGGCPKCQTEKLAQEHERLRTKHISSGKLGQTAVPPIVDEVLSAPGQPLDAAVRAFMEPRFGQDFSRVRVHTDPLAARSVEALAAQAYTMGFNVVFGMGCYAPASRDGQRLLAHELAHVVQQNTSYSAPGIVQRSPNNKPVDSGTGVPEDRLLGSNAYWPKHLDYDQEILMLAANPDHAHDRWKGLTPQEQIGVAVYMARFYGAPFAKQFVDIHKAAKAPKTVMGQQVGSDTTPAQLTARGFHLAGEQAQISVALQMHVEIWFHPSGSRLHRVLHLESPEPEPEEGREDCTAQADAMSSLLSDTISDETKTKEYLEGLKGQLEKMDKTTGNYRKQYIGYIHSLQDMILRLRDDIDTVHEQQKQLEEIKCPTVALSTIDIHLQDLSDLQMWADFESDPFTTQFLQPLDAPHIKDLP